MFLRSALLIEGLRVDRAIHMGSVRLEPLPIELGFAGRELREPFNRLLAQHGFATAIEKPVWGAQIGTRRRLCLATTPALPVEAATVGASFALSALLEPMVDALALTLGGTLNVFAAVHEQSANGADWQPFVVMVGSGQHPGSTLERLASDGDRITPVRPEDVWKRATTDPLLALWMSLFRSSIAEPRWDVRILRCCSLLEAIGRERLMQSREMAGPDGQPLLDNAGGPATTNSLRGMIYALVSRAVHVLATSERTLLAHSSRTLWEEVGVWVDVRNIVGHEGLWRPPELPSNLKAPRRRTAAAFELAGRGDGVDSGAQRYADAAVAGTEAVVRAIASGAAFAEREGDLNSH